jgi:phosphoribosyl 1,2-cyclic phosphodiesterase
MQVTFWGVRGSYPVPGPATIRYGGNTSCLEVQSSDGQRAIIDAGTGLRSLGQKLAGASKGNGRYDILLSHVHWDHIQGLPFFEPAYSKGTQISIHALRNAADELHHVIGGITRQEFFPISLDAAPAQFEFHEVQAAKEFRIRDLRVLPIALNHPFGAVGYRIWSDETSLAYISDTAPFGDLLHKQYFLAGPEKPTDADRQILAKMRKDLIDGLRGTHTVVYDTHFLPEEYLRFPHYGHSTPEHALEIAAEVGVKRLVLYHHAPNHDDDVMDKIEAQYRERGSALGIDVVAAREGMTLRVGRHPTDPGVGA